MKQFKHKKLSCLLAVALGFSAQAYAQGFRIADIRLEGLQRVSASPVFAALPLQVGDEADIEAIRSAVRSIFATGFFDDVQVLQDGAVLIVRVKERPTISEITIDGNKAIKTEALQDAMKQNDLAEGQIFQRGTLDGIVAELERQYVAQGRYAAEVTANVAELPNNQVKVEVLVDEGDVASIRHINIVGNKVFKDADLLDLFELNTRGWLSWFTSDDRYAREKLRGDIERLESFYLDQGYLDFRVLSSQVSLSPDQKSVYITLNIEEGEVYTISEISLAGDLIVPEENIRGLIRFREGDTFSQGVMTSTSEYITTLMGNAGYTNADVKGIPTPDPVSKTVEVTFFVDPGNRVYVRRINFRGNTRTQDEVLRREMRQMEGSSASNARIEQGKVRLERLGFFSQVDVANQEVPGSGDLIDLEYTVEEQPSGSVNASIGYGQGTGVMLGASLQQNNWMGTGKQVGVSVNRSPYQTLYNLSYTDPYFTPDGVSRGINLFYNTRDYSRINVSTYSTDSYGLNFTFGYPISEIQRLNYSIGYTHLSVKTGAETAQEIRRTPFELPLEQNTFFYTTREALRAAQEFLGSVDEPQDYSLDADVVTPDMLVHTEPGFVDRFGDEFDMVNFKFTWLRSTLNRGIFATRGSRQTLSLDVAVPGSDLQYATLQYEGQLLVPLSQDFTVKFRTSLGYGDGYGDFDRLPFFRNFYAGGFGSVRGFRRSTLGPQATPPAFYSLANPFSGQNIMLDYTAIDTNGDGVNDSYSASNPGYLLCDSDLAGPAGRPFCVDGELARSYGQMSRRTSNFGGNVLIEFGAELLFPLPFIEDQRAFQTSLFLDVGNVFDSKCSEYQVNCTNFELQELRASVGLSLNWLSPMGPLAFSFAKPIKYDRATDEREGFQFSLGAPF